MLYLIKEYGKNNKEYLKIGKAHDVNKRMQQYNTNCAEFELIDTFEGSLPEESLLHSFLEKYKIKGEWMEYNDEILLLWKLYKEIRPKVKESILATGEFVEEELYNSQINYYKDKVEKLQNETTYLKDECFCKLKQLESRTSKFTELYDESSNLIQFILKIIPLNYRTQIFEKFKGKLQYFKFKEEI